VLKFWFLLSIGQKFVNSLTKNLSINVGGNIILLKGDFYYE